MPVFFVLFVDHGCCRSTGTWNSGLKSGLYLVALLWCFLGVAIIADIFMEAIEAITSTKTKYKGADGEEYEVDIGPRMDFTIQCAFWSTVRHYSTMND